MVLAWAAATWMYLHGPFVTELNSDAAVPVLLAREMLRYRSLVPSTWSYANGDIWLLGPQLPVLPFVAALGPGAPAAAWGAGLALVLCAVAFLGLARALGAGWLTALVASAGVLSQFSVVQRYFVQAQLSYGWLAATLAVLLWASVRACFTGARPGPWLVLLGGLTAVTAASNPVRLAVFWLLPVLTQVRRDGRSLALAGWSVSGFVVGALAHRGLEHLTHVERGLIASSAVGQWRPALALFRAGVPLLLGDPALGPVGWLGTGLRGVLVAMTLVALALAWKPGPRGEDGYRFAGRVVGVMLALVTASFLLGGLAVDPLSVRYFIPPLLLGLTVALCWAVHRLGEARPAGAALLLCFALVFAGAGVASVVTVARALPPECPGERRVCRLAEVLLHAGVSSGFATHWRAGSVTVTTGGVVEVCPIQLDATIRPSRWLTSEDCFGESRTRGGYFLVLDPEERARVDGGDLGTRLGAPVRTLSAGALEVRLYPPGTPPPWTVP